jgi:heme/copper-type cytochrome/quinol oxidase subunit 2
MKNEVVDSFYLVEAQNIGVMEPVPVVPLNMQQNNSDHNTFLIIVLVFALIILVGLAIYFIRKKIRSKYDKTLINYEMERL